jgi:hypothetical protein
MDDPVPSTKREAVSTRLRTIQGLAIGLVLLVSLFVPIHARAASSALDGQNTSSCGTLQVEQPFRTIQP